MALLIAGSWTRQPLKVPADSNYSMVYMWYSVPADLCIFESAFGIRWVTILSFKLDEDAVR